MVIRRCIHGQVSVKQWLLKVPLFACRLLTEEVVPLRVQVCLVSQTATHHIQTVILAGFQGYLARAVGTVQHLHGRSHTAGRGADLE